jgi:CBS domain-containing protein
MKGVKAKDVMIKNPLTIGSNEKLALADLKMTRSNIGGLPVVNGKKLVGIITQRDIMLARNYDIGGLPAKDMMNKKPFTVSPNTSLKKVLAILLENKIERLPVIDKGKFVGLIVHGNILKAIYNEL